MSENTIKIRIGSVLLNGEPVPAMSGFAYEGPIEGLGSAVEAAIDGKPAKAAKRRGKTVR